MISDSALPDESEDQRLVARVERLERSERAIAARQEHWLHSITVVTYSVCAAITLVGLLAIAEWQGWIASASLGQGSWVVTLALAGTLINASALLCLAAYGAVRARRRPLSQRAQHEGGAAAAE